MNSRFYYSDGSILDYQQPHKTLHREGGPAVEIVDGYKVWYLNGKRHREDGPAVEYASGYKVWYLNGRCHREDGPALEHPDGSKFWYLNGVRYSEEEYSEEEYYQELNQINSLPNILKLVDPRDWVRAKYQGEAHEG